MVHENGYVTRAELKAHLDPMKYDIIEIASDVKILVLRSAGNKALSHTFWRGISIAATLFCGVLAGIAFH